MTATIATTNSAVSTIIVTTTGPFMWAVGAWWSSWAVSASMGAAPKALPRVVSVLPAGLSATANPRARGGAAGSSGPVAPLPEVDWAGGMNGTCRWAPNAMSRWRGAGIIVRGRAQGKPDPAVAMWHDPCDARTSVQMDWPCGRT